MRRTWSPTTWAARPAASPSASSSAQGWVGQSWARGSGRYECLASATAREGPEDLRRLEGGEPVADVEEYFRYWAGWTVISRPVLALWGLEALRRISGAMLVLSGAAAVVLVA